MRPSAALLILVLASQSHPAPPAVGIEMRNVRLHVSPDAILEVKWLKGRLRSTTIKPPVFDDQNAYIMEIDDGEMAVDARNLTSLVNAAFDYRGSALSNLSITFADGRLVQRGTLKKGISVPFVIQASIATTPEGRLIVHPVKVKTAGVPTTKLMSLFGVELDEILKGRPDRGITFRGNDLLLEPTRMIPAPQTTGKLSNAFIRDDRLVEVFGKGGGAAARTSGNYIWFRGAMIQFGRLTMSDTDLKLIDMDPRDPFDFSPAHYNEQLVAGYSKNTPDHALRTYMPDFDDLHRPRR